MKARCPSQDELLRLVDGELTENRAAALRAHLAACPACAAEDRATRALVERLAAPVPGLPSPGAVAAVLRRAQAGEPGPAPARWRPRVLLPLLAGPLLAAAAIAAVVAVRPETPGSPEFVARGGAAAWPRTVGAELWTLEPLRKVETGTALRPDAALVGRYRNAGAAGAYLLAFAVDARGEVHWLYPAFTTAGSDPAAVALPPAAAGALPDAVVLSDLLPGPLRLLTLISPEPLAVSHVESLPAADLSLDALRQRFPRARVEAVDVQVTPPPAELP